jgi:hypothetical protein
MFAEPAVRHGGGNRAQLRILEIAEERHPAQAYRIDHSRRFGQTTAGALSSGAGEQRRPANSDGGFGRLADIASPRFDVIVAT